VQTVNCKLQSDNVAARGQQVTLLEVLDRVLEKGVVLSGDITISVADVDLIFLGLRVILSSVETMEQARRSVSSVEYPVSSALGPSPLAPCHSSHSGHCV
jgi:hypothetical protein